jgi:cysteinyl-tRNA synthetase
MSLPDLVFYNTLTRQKEPFTPLQPGVVKIYLCGLTVYDEWHLGHALQALLFDALRRYLTRRGIHVVFANNFTDIDDKIILRAQKEQVDFREITERYIGRFLADLPRLNIQPAEIFPRATEHIAQIQDLIRRLIERGHAYAAEGNVLFAVSSFGAYGQLSGQDPAALTPADDLPASSARRHAADFALWKAAKPGEPQWDSPWGPGRPGWHIECSAMALQHLGETFDIHGGGLDLIFPHHENEKAQSEAATGKPFARVWLHNGLLRLKGEKMSKSLGNILTVAKLLEKYSPNQIRHFVLSSHYRSPAEFDFKLLDDSGKALERVSNLLDRIDAYRARPAEPDSPLASGAIALRAAREEAEQRFEAAMADDFNTAGAIGALFELVGDANRWLQVWEKRPARPEAAHALEEAATCLRAAFAGLGFFTVQGGPPSLDDGQHRAGRYLRQWREVEQPLRDLFERIGLRADVPPGGQSDLVTFFVSALIQVRDEARRRKEFAKSDLVRDELAKLGIELKDSPEGTRFTFKPRGGVN